MVVVAVFTLYEPDLEFLKKAVFEIVDCFSAIVFVDNSGGRTELGWAPGSAIIVRQDNKGISGGVNSALDVIPDDVTHVMLFDQDSYIDNSNLRSFLSFSGRHSLFISAPCPVDSNSQSIHDSFYRKYKSRTVDGVLIYDVPRTQLSGMLIERSVFREVGRMNADFFLNLADTEWCIRAKHHGYSILVLDCFKIVHSFGEGELNLGLFKVSYGAPFRTYYTSRDCLQLAALPITPISLKCKLIISSAVNFFAIAFLDHKIKRYSYWFKGVGDFFSGRRGPL